MDVCDGACAVCGVDEALGVDSGVLCPWRRCGEGGAGMEGACGVDPPDELVFRDHIGTFQMG